MTPRQHQKGLSAIVEAIGESIDNITEARQEAIYKRLMGLLNNPKYALDLTPNGLIRPTGANLRKIAQILARLKPYLMVQQYQKVINDFSRTYEKIESFNSRWFQDLAVGFKPKPIYRDVKTLSVERTLTSLNPQGFREALEEPITQLLKNFTQNNGNWLEMTEQLSRGLLGVKDKKGDKVIRGYLDNYHWRKRITRDAMFQYARNYDQVVSADLGLEWAYYAGGEVDDTRDFCMARIDKYWHIEEIKSWSKLSWQGKARGTTRGNIQTQLGGYNCRHHLNYVTERFVPKADLERAREKGFIE